MMKTILTALLMAVAICFTACKKERFDDRNDNRFTALPRQASTARIINLGGFNQVIANGVRITDSVFYDPLGPDYYKETGTSYFPKNGRLGSNWQIPQDLFGAANSLELKFSYIGANNAAAAPPFSMPAISEEYNKPVDYYLLPVNMASALPAYAAIERSTIQPSKPDYFKIRIINLAATVEGSVPSPRGSRENLVGPVTLAYADGTPVAAQTTGITWSQRSSEYVELPYGTYQFKVLTENGRQIPGANGVDGMKIIDPPTSDMGVVAAGVPADSKLSYAPVMTYQPGGVYTIVVTPYNFNYLSEGAKFESGAFQNAFYVVADVNAPVNTTYCRVQGANALPGSGQVNFRAGGQALPGSTAYGAASAYVNCIQGTQTIEATDAAGTVLATAVQTFRAEQNYTIWLYADAAGKPQLLLVPNDMSGAGGVAIRNGQDVSLDVFTVTYMSSKRFLNLSPDNPYITFTFDNGLPAMANLQPGMLNAGIPYASEGLNNLHLPFEIMAYRSAPNLVPGTWAKDIPVLKSSSFIARADMYTTAGRNVPANEPGVYTVALIGRSAAGAPAADKAKFIIVKHNR